MTQAASGRVCVCVRVRVCARRCMYVCAGATRFCRGRRRRCCCCCLCRGRYKMVDLRLPSTPAFHVSLACPLNSHLIPGKYKMHKHILLVVFRRILVKKINTNFFPLGKMVC